MEYCILKEDPCGSGRFVQETDKVLSDPREAEEIVRSLRTAFPAWHWEVGQRLKPEWHVRCAHDD